MTQPSDRALAMSTSLHYNWLARSIKTKMGAKAKTTDDASERDPFGPDIDCGRWSS